MLFLAEVGDKFFTLPEIALAAAALGLAAVAVGRVNKWLLLAPLLITVAANLLFIRELQHTGFGHKIVQERGALHLTLMFLAWNLPVLAGLGYATLRKKRRA